jgi:hypothetical protein
VNVLRNLIDRITGRAAERERELAEWHRRDAEFEALLTAWEFRPVIGCPPDPFAPALFVRKEWDEPKVLRLAECDPSFNVANLYWRPIQSRQLH